MKCGSTLALVLIFIELMGVGVIPALKTEVQLDKLEVDKRYCNAIRMIVDERGILLFTDDSVIYLPSGGDYKEIKFPFFRSGYSETFASKGFVWKGSYVYFAKIFVSTFDIIRIDLNTGLSEVMASGTINKEFSYLDAITVVSSNSELLIKATVNIIPQDSPLDNSVIYKYDIYDIEADELKTYNFENDPYMQVKHAGLFNKTTVYTWQKDDSFSGELTLLNLERRQVEVRQVYPNGTKIDSSLVINGDLIVFRGVSENTWSANYYDIEQDTLSRQTTFSFNSSYPSIAVRDNNTLLLTDVHLDRKAANLTYRFFSLEEFNLTGGGSIEFPGIEYIRSSDATLAYLSKENGGQGRCYLYTPYSYEFARWIPKMNDNYWLWIAGGLGITVLVTSYLVWRRRKVRK